MGWTNFFLFLHLLVMAPELVYLTKMYLLHHLVDLSNFNTLTHSVIPFPKALEQANKIVQENQGNPTDKWPKIKKMAKHGAKKNR